MQVLEDDGELHTVLTVGVLVGVVDVGLQHQVRNFPRQVEHHQVSVLMDAKVTRDKLGIVRVLASNSEASLERRGRLGDNIADCDIGGG